MAIQNRRGAYVDFDPTKMVAGEFAVVQSGDENTDDGKALYVAPTTGSVKRIPFADELEGLVEVDDTLTEAGAAADAKKTGDEITALRVDFDQLVPGLSENAKTALLACFAHVAWTDAQSQDYYDALEAALYADDVKSISAVFTPGTHEVYPTDSLESLRNFLVVTATYNDDTQAVVTDYILEGDITSTGTKTITVKYGRLKTTLFTVNVVANTNGLIYEWDFTKGLTDLRQNQTGSFVSLDGVSDAYIDSAGMHFTSAGQAFMCFPTDAVDVSWRQRPISYFVGKTIQIDVTSFVPNSADNDYHTRFIMFRHTSAGWDSGLVYRATYNNRGWNVYTGSTWGATNPWNMSNKDAISGHKISMFINSSKQAKIYVDGASKGVVSSAFIDDLFGLMIGNNDTAARGATLYTAIITGVRIYDGEVA